MSRGAYFALTSSPLAGLIIAVYALASYYVEAMRRYAPFTARDVLDIPAHVFNIFFFAARNTVEVVPNLLRGQLGAAVDNLSQVAGIRTEVYAQVLNHDATSNAERFILIAPWVLGGMLVLRLAGLLIRLDPLATRTLPPEPQRWRQRLRRTGVFAELVLLFGAKIMLAAAFFGMMFLNTIGYYQGMSGVTGLIGSVGHLVVQAYDYATVGLVWVVKEASWHLSYLLGTGQPQLLGRLAASETVEHAVHYLQTFPEDRRLLAMQTALYQATLGAIAFGLAYFLQDRRVEAWARGARPATIPRNQVAARKASR